MWVTHARVLTGISALNGFLQLVQRLQCFPSRPIFRLEHVRNDGASDFFPFRSYGRNGFCVHTIPTNFASTPNGLQQLGPLHVRDQRNPLRRDRRRNG